jgi:alpha-L-arabinofuranosidase
MNMYKYLRFAAMALALAGFLWNAHAAEPDIKPVRLDIYPEQVSGPISPYVFGAGLDHKTSPMRFARYPDLVARQVRESGLRIGRYPGGFVFRRNDHRGSWANFYWQDHLDKNPHRNPLEVFDLDTFMQFCERFNIEPLMQINFVGEPEDSVLGYIEYLTGTGDMDGDGTDWAARRAANGRTAPYKVRYWQLGNEVHSYPQGFQESAAGAREYAETVNRLVPKIRRLAPDARILLPFINIERPVSGFRRTPHQPDINFATSAEFALAFLKHLEVKVDYFDWHFYPANGWKDRWPYQGTDDEWKHYYCWGTKFRECYQAIVAMLQKHCRQQPPPTLIVGEWSGDVTADIFRAHPDAMRGSLARTMASGVYMADILMFMMENSTPDKQIHAAFWHNFSNVSQELFSIQVTEEYIRKLGALKPYPGKGVNTDEGYGRRHPVYWVFKLLSEHHGNLLVNSRLQGDINIKAPADGLYTDPPYHFPRLTHCATRCQDKLFLALVNKDAHASVPLSIEIHARPVDGTAAVYTVGADHYLAENTLARPDRVALAGPEPLRRTGKQWEYCLPPNTLAVLQFIFQSKCNSLQK